MKSQKVKNSPYNLNKRGNLALLDSKITRCFRKLEDMLLAQGQYQYYRIQKLETFSFMGV